MKTRRAWKSIQWGNEKQVGGLKARPASLRPFWLATAVIIIVVNLKKIQIFDVKAFVYCQFFRPLHTRCSHRMWTVALQKSNLFSDLGRFFRTLSVRTSRSQTEQTLRPPPTTSATTKTTTTTSTNWLISPFSLCLSAPGSVWRTRHKWSCRQHVAQVAQISRAS